MADAPHPVHLLFSFRGRISRRWFWLGMILVIIVFFGSASLAANMFHAKGGAAAENALMLLAAALAAYLSAALIVKRLRDRGRPAWWFLIYGVIPFFLYYAALQIAAPAANDPGLPAVACNTAALTIWLFALIDLGILRGVERTSADELP